MFNKSVDMAAFIRLKLCIFVSAMGLSGYIIFGTGQELALPVTLSSFFLCAGTYSFNNIMDLKEDNINRKTARLSSSPVGLLLSVACLTIGGIFSLTLSSTSVVVYLLASFLGIVYSGFRLKRYIIVKNLYTGFGVMLAFIIGAANPIIIIDVIFYYISLSVFVVLGSIISDMRDIAGDREQSIKTIPVIFGYTSTKRFLFAGIVSYGIFIFTAMQQLSFILLFLVLMIAFLYADKTKLAHLSGSLAFIFMVLLSVA